MPSNKSRQRKAVRKLQHFFLNSVKPMSLQRVAKRFLQDAGASSLFEQARTIPFDQLSARLRNPNLIDAAGALLLRLLKLINWQRNDKPCVTGVVNVKIFLAAYMIIGNPSNVFEGIEELERKLVDASMPMLECVHATANALCEGQRWSDLAKEGGAAQELASSICLYLRAFKEWKVVDEPKLGRRLEHALRQLENARGRLLESESSMRTELDAQIERIQGRLKQIVGINKVQPQVLTQTVGVDTSPAGVPVAPPPPSTTFIGGMTNEQLAHELNMDPSFSLEGYMESSSSSEEAMVRTRIREVFERSFWLSLRDDLDMQPRTYARVLAVLEEISSSIQKLSKGFPESNQIQGIIDMDLLKQQVSTQSLENEDCKRLFERIVSVIVSIHERMKLFHRKEETESRWACIPDNTPSQRICDSLEFCLDRIHSIRIDQANNKLRAIAPVMKDHGVEYERSCFRKRLNAHEITLSQTKAWIQSTIQKMPEMWTDLSSGSSLAFEKVLHKGMVDLVVNNSVLPETLLLDKLRFHSLHHQFHQYVDTATTILSVNQMLTLHLKMNKSAAKKIVEQVSSAVAEGSSVLHVLDNLLTQEDKALVMDVVGKNLERSSQVRSLLVTRFRNFWTSLLAQCPDSELEHLPELARCIAPSAEKSASLLRKIFVLNKKVHVGLYNSLIKEAVGALP